MSTRTSDRILGRDPEVRNIPKIGDITTNTDASPRNVSPEKGKKNKRKHQNRKIKAGTHKVSAKSAAKPKQIFWDEIFTERAGPDGEYVVIIVKQKGSGNAGYIHNLLKALQNDDTMVARLKSESEFDCRISTTLFLRQSHDINKKVTLGYGSNSNIHRIGLVGNPNFKFRLPTKDPVQVELLMRDQCEKILRKTSDTTSNRVTHYMSWNKDKHSTTTNPPRSLDEIFVDETVDIIMMAYAFKEGFNRLDVYEDFKKKGIKGYYSRSTTTGMYSVYAQEHFGYPTDKKTNGEESASVYSTSDEEDDPVFSSNSNSEVPILDLEPHQLSSFESD